jgi:hypothetical protein
MNDNANALKQQQHFKSINETLRELSIWLQQADESIKGITTTLDAVGQRLAVLEKGSMAGARTPATELDEGENLHTSGALNVLAPRRGSWRRESPHTPVQFEIGERSAHYEDSSCKGSCARYHRSRPPKTDFPEFDVKNPKWWRTICENYFVFMQDHDTWASFSIMHFVGNPALWLQTHEVEHDVDSWEDLCVAIHTKFGKDKHHKYLEALERCKQAHAMEKYHQKF